MIKRLWKRYFGRKSVREIRIVHRDILEVSIAEWRAEPALVKASAAIVNSDHFRQMLDVLLRTAPGGNVMNELLPERARVVVQARNEGYLMCLSDIKSMAIFEQPKSNVMPEAEFAPPEEEEEEPTN